MFKFLIHILLAFQIIRFYLIVFRRVWRFFGMKPRTWVPMLQILEVPSKYSYQYILYCSLTEYSLQSRGIFGERTLTPSSRNVLAAKRP